MDYYLRLSIFALLIHFTMGHIIVYKSKYNMSVEEFYDLPAQFGPSIPSNGLTVYAIEANPKNACTRPPQAPTDSDSKFALIIARNNCTFEEKVRNAQLAGYDAAIVYNIGSDDLEQMSAKNSDNINIPSVFVGETTGGYIMEDYHYQSGYYLVINDELPFNINTHLIIPFSILVGLCFIIMIVYMIYKCAREHRRLRQHRLPKRLLKKIPTMKFTKGLPYESCVICLDDYVEGDKLRILPCQHAYHCDCIDTWLTKNRRVCPICKRKVFPKGELSRRSRRRPASSDSMSDSETDDTTPLLNSAAVENNANNTNHGTFNTSQSNQNPTNASNEQQTQRRTNPFDRIPNSSADNIQGNMANVSRGISSVFSMLRFFRYNRRSSSPQQANHNVVENLVNPIVEDGIVRSVAVDLPAAQTSSNNVLNTNLSGSFKENQNQYQKNNDNNNDDDDDEDGNTERKTIYEPVGVDPSTALNIYTTTTTTSINDDVDENNTDRGRMESTTTDSIFIQTPSSGGIGVAALPNTSFRSNNTNTNSNNSNRRRGGRGRGGRRDGGNKRNNSLFIV